MTMVKLTLELHADQEEVRVPDGVFLIGPLERPRVSGWYDITYDPQDQFVNVIGPFRGHASAQGATRTIAANPPQSRWLLEWKHNRGYRDMDVWASADSAEEARAAIEGILASDTWTPEGAEELGGEETEPAYVALVREAFEGDIVNGLSSLRHGGSTFPCDEGTLRIERER
jgi:hypothetical protein